ncbi:MAG: hypothetical protein A2297_01310 [Elusimicrobia bacterium RIFOXYB2_FULL_48_7]|nr:MAG: hypothetical protein A2297_01310 [Elusimicrobia bacterium RIFOXYB2_FULL_48_7]
MKNPKLRVVDKYKAPFQLNKFPHNFAIELGKEIIYFLASRGTPRLEGSDWEEIFARLINAQWKPSNVGLDDIVFGQTAWGAKTVKNPNPLTATAVRLISGRNSPTYSFGARKIVNCDPNDLGQQILSIWNTRVVEVRRSFKNLRTVVLIKSNDLLELSVFEFETQEFIVQNYYWEWNANKNLIGYNSKTKEHVFTWQPHGSQFTILEKVPQERISIRIKKPPKLDKETILKTLKFSNSWIQVIK